MQPIPNRKRLMLSGGFGITTALALLGATAQAGQVQISNPGANYRGDTGGGEFTTRLSDDLVADQLTGGIDILGAYFDGNGANGTSNVGGAGPSGFSNSVQTFCLERTDYFGWNNTYNADPNHEAIVGGNTQARRGGSATNDPLSLGTAWLITNWASGGLDTIAPSMSTYDPTAQSSATLDRRDSSRILQNTIWFLEHEYLAGELNSTWLDEVNAMLAIIASSSGINQADLFNDNYVNGQYTYNAMAINIGSPNTNPQYLRQDQLIAFTTTGDSNVPDGGTGAILLGLALGGLGVFRRLAKK